MLPRLPLSLFFFFPPRDAFRFTQDTWGENILYQHEASRLPRCTVEWSVFYSSHLHHSHLHSASLETRMLHIRTSYLPPVCVCVCFLISLWLAFSAALCCVRHSISPAASLMYTLTLTVTQLHQLSHCKWPEHHFSPALCTSCVSVLPSFTLLLSSALFTLTHLVHCPSILHECRPETSAFALPSLAHEQCFSPLPVQRTLSFYLLAVFTIANEIDGLAFFFPFLSFPLFSSSSSCALLGSCRFFLLFHSPCTTLVEVFFFSPLLTSSVLACQLQVTTLGQFMCSIRSCMWHSSRHERLVTSNNVVSFIFAASSPLSLSLSLYFASASYTSLSSRPFTAIEWVRTLPEFFLRHPLTVHCKVHHSARVPFLLSIGLNWLTNAMPLAICLVVRRRSSSRTEWKLLHRMEKNCNKNDAEACSFDKKCPFHSLFSQLHLLHLAPIEWNCLSINSVPHSLQCIHGTALQTSQ